MNSIEIISRWIDIAHRYNMNDRVAQFWLLRDFAEQSVWSDRFYKEHAQEAWIILVELDDTKPEVKIVLDELLPIVKGYMV